MSNGSPIDDAINAADQAAEQASVPANTNEGGAPAPADMGGGSPMGLDDFVVGQMNVEGYVKVDRHGLHLDNNDEDKFDHLDVILDPSEIQVTEAIKFGNPPTYYKTLDRVNCVQGGTWANAIREAQKADPKAKPYKSADIPMELLNETEAGGSTYEAGTRVGHSLSTTNGGEFQTFLRELQKQGLRNSRVQVRLKPKKQSNQKYKWAIISFELLGAADQQAA